MKYPKMTRCHFQFVADIIKDMDVSYISRTVNPCVHTEAREQIAQAFADELYGTNGMFDRGRFMSACENEQEQERKQIIQKEDK